MGGLTGHGPMMTEGDRACPVSRNHHPHLWPPFTSITTTPPLEQVVRGEGALLYRSEGPPLIDAISSWWVTLHGHAHPVVAAAIAEQAATLEQVIFAEFSHPQAERLSERLAQRTGLDRVFFSDNGSTAVEVALKTAVQWWHNRGEPRQQLIAFEGAYHGDTFGAMAVGARSLFSEPFDPLLFPVRRVPWPHTHWNDEEVEQHERQALNSLDQALQTPTAAVILEPMVQGAGGMRMVRPQFLQAVEQRVRESGTLLIADEVLAGFGRCGRLLASHRAGIQPDLVALSKGLTAGFLPMGITMASERIFQDFLGRDPTKTLWHGHSFTANPLGCAAANASLDLLEEEPARHERFEHRHQSRLDSLARHPRVQRPRLCGTIAAFDLVTDGEQGYLNPAGKVLRRLMRDQGVLIRPLGDVVYLLPPLCISDAQLDHCYAALLRSLESLSDA